MRFIIAIVLMFGSVGAASGAEKRVVDGDGKAIGVIVDCNTCQGSDTGAGCFGGVKEGFHNGKRCGACLLSANYGVKLSYAFDLQLSGTLVDKDDKPLTEDFIRLFLPNSWTVRTRSGDDGFFRLVLGATLDRKGTPLEVDLGKQRREQSAGDADYSLYFLPDNYKPCEAK